MCGLNPQLCICQHIPRLQTRTRLALVIHAKELKRTTNSGTLALAALINSEQRIRGLTPEAVDLSDLIRPEYESILLYPSDGAQELSPNTVKDFSKPVLLIVPDGNWRQASKVHTRHLELAALRRVMIKTPNLAEHHLRRESNPYGMSTLEAIARAFAVLEGEEAGLKLMRLYKAKLQATLTGRGVKVGDESLDP